ncbi:hypothetical protein [Streptomonospora salina]|uniref:hypothetical protein n=1 Tax=Streptomonospora salina TaxID=104205 RepID=UPI0031EF207B
MRLLFNQSAVRVRAGTATDRAGNEVPDWSDTAVDRLPLSGLNIAPRVEGNPETVEDTGVQVITGWWLQTAPGTTADIKAGDRIEFDGHTTAVEGQPGVWPDPFTGRPHHIKVSLERVAHI